MWRWDEIRSILTILEASGLNVHSYRDGGLKFIEFYFEGWPLTLADSIQCIKSLHVHGAALILDKGKPFLLVGISRES